MDNRHNGKSNIFANFSWAFAERIMAQIVSFVVSIILARLLAPEDYGVIAMVSVFTGISSALALTGFGSSLIQKKEASDVDFSSTLYFSFGVICVVYLILFFLAPYLSVWTGYEGLTPYIRAMSLTLVASSIITVQNAYVMRQMKFRLLFLTSVCATGLSACVGIFMALHGYGAWALVGQCLTKSAADVIVISLLSGWRPRLVFSMDSIRTVYGFGWKIAVSSVTDALYRQLRSLVIGVKYTSADLAFYDKGNQFPSLLITNVDSTIANVLMPILSRMQEDRQAVKDTVRKAIQISSTVLFPALIGLAVCGESVITLILTEKWLPCVPYLRCLCIALMIKPLQTANFQGLLAIGRSDVYLRVQMAQKTVGVFVILVTALLFDSVLLIAAGEIVAYVIFELINIRPNRVYLNYTFSEHIADFLPQLLVALVMGGAVFLIGTLRGPGFFTLVLQVAIGAAVYIALSAILRLPPFLFLLRFLLQKRKKPEDQHD